jgi:hypothetical protein
MADAGEIFKSVEIGKTGIFLIRPNFGVEGAYSNFCKQKALTALREARMLGMLDDEYKLAWQSFLLACGTGKFSYMSPDVQASLGGADEWIEEWLFLVITSVACTDGFSQEQVTKQRAMTREQVHKLCQENIVEVGEAMFQVRFPNQKIPSRPEGAAVQS